MTAEDVLSPPSARSSAGTEFRPTEWSSTAKSKPPEKLATFLGWFSIGLGLAELITPRGLGRLIGVKASPTFTRIQGLREIGAGIGILTNPRPVNWMRARIAGDAMDLGTLAKCYTSSGADTARLNIATAAVAGVTVLDVICARQLADSPEESGMVGISKSLAINKPAAECYRFWRQFENLPKFMDHLVSVNSLGGNRSRWEVKAPAGAVISWEAEITREEDGKLIEWRSLPGAAVDNFGSVKFAPMPDGRGTLVRVQLRYDAPAGNVGVAVAKLFGEEPEIQVREDLRRFKRMMESGELPTIKGQSSGRGIDE